ncbi:MAG: lipid A export permease/ATP-binding protein MsbA [Betaproteobacteria bacterium]
MARLVPYFASPSWLWGVVVLTTVVGSASEAAVPGLLNFLVTKGFAQHSFALWIVPCMVIGLFAFRGLAGFMAQMALTRIANNGIFKLRTEMFQKLQSAGMQLFSQQSASTLANTVVYEVQTGSNQLVYALLSLTKDGLTVVFLLGMLFYRNWQLTLIVLFLFPSVSWVMKTLSKRLYRITRASQAATDELAYVVEENILAHRTIRLHGAQASQSERFRGSSDGLRRLAVKSSTASSAMTPLTQMLGAAALSAVVTIALWQSQSGSGNVGDFIEFVTGMLLLLAPIKHLADVANPITRGLAAVERGLQLIDDTQSEASGATVMQRAQGQLQFDAVSLRYAEDVEPALDQVNLAIAPGEIVAFVGPSGAGKTSLMNLLPRFILPTGGEVLVDGVRAQEWDIQSLRRQFAMVSQDVVMLNDSVAANVALGQALDRERVAHCLEAANLSQHVASLPLGMDTLVGHNAVQFSGGQRQRLAIARALYKDAPILILDEATSALDNESERLVQEALQRLMTGRTTLIVAHRISTIEHADRIVVMAGGRIVEQGPHAALVRQQGLYWRLHQLGFGNHSSPAGPSHHEPI